MTRLIAGGFAIVILIETLGFLAEPWLALPAAGVALAGFVLLLGNRLPDAGAVAGDARVDAAVESLQRWRAQTESMISRADSTRGDWDRHLRPRLAREFILATNQKDPQAQQATGRMVFGEDLWQWVDPGNVARTGRDAPGPGRAALAEILRRLEQI